MYLSGHNVDLKLLPHDAIVRQRGELLLYNIGLSG
jgi:hypothetical protein